MGGAGARAAATGCRRGVAIVGLVSLVVGDALAQEVSPVVTGSREGVRVVVFQSLAETERLAWTVDTVPAVSIGSGVGAGPYVFSRVVGARSLGDGFVVADGPSAQLRWFDDRGRHRKTLPVAGRRRRDPVDLRWIGRMRGDTIVAWDARGRRISWYDGASGGAVRSVALPRSPAYLIVGVFDDGQLLVRPFLTRPGRSGPGEMVRPEAAFAVTRPGTGALDTIFRLPVRPTYTGLDGVASLQPFTVEPAVAVRGEVVWAGSGDTGEVVRYRGDGSVELILRLPDGGEVDAAAVETFRGQDLDGRRGADRIQRKALLQEMPFPRTFPAFDELRVDDRGRLWVRRYPRPGADRRHWVVFDVTGDPVGAVDLPDGRLLDLAGDRVLVVRPGEAGTDRLLVYRVRVAAEGTREP